MFGCIRVRPPCSPATERVPFPRSIRVTIEHGHATRRGDDRAPGAYRYRAEPHRPFGILAVAERLPRPL